MSEIGWTKVGFTDQARPWTGLSAPEEKVITLFLRQFGQARPGAGLSAPEEKVFSFLRQFGSEDEFIGWCEVQGVKGVKGASSRCLVSQAVWQATGVPVATGSVTWLQREMADHPRAKTAWMLPMGLLDVPRKFDEGWWPHLEEPTCPS